MLLLSHCREKFKSISARPKYFKEVFLPDSLGTAHQTGAVNGAFLLLRIFGG